MASWVLLKTQDRVLSSQALGRAQEWLNLHFAYPFVRESGRGIRVGRTWTATIVLFSRGRVNYLFGLVPKRCARLLQSRHWVRLGTISGRSFLPFSARRRVLLMASYAQGETGKRGSNVPRSALWV